MQFILDIPDSKRNEWFIDHCYVSIEPRKVSFSDYVKARKVKIENVIFLMFWFLKYILFTLSREEYIREEYIEFANNILKNIVEINLKKQIEKINLRGYLLIIITLLKNQKARFKEFVVFLYKNFFQIKLYDDYLIVNLFQEMSQNHNLIIKKAKNGNKKFSKNNSKYNPK